MKNLRFIIVILCLQILWSCADFLDVKPQSTLEIPRTLQDLQAILNNDGRQVRNVFPASGDIGSDYYVLEDATWASSRDFVRELYVWDENAQTERDWHGSYVRIFDTNVVLDYIDQVDYGVLGETQKMEIKGRALFMRAWSYMQLVHLFAPAYEKEKAEQLLGVPLRLTSDLNETIFRSNLEETYRQIREDLEVSATLLPDYARLPLFPTKASAWAALSRLCLWMGEFENALHAAEEGLKFNSQLIDYNTLDENSVTPFELYNEEVLFHCTMRATGSVFTHTSNYASPELIGKYMSGDLRFRLYFQRADNDKYHFKGDYSNYTNALYYGITTDELYLTKAECLARLDRSSDALNTMNSLLEKRWVTDQFTPFEIPDHDILSFILDERYKSLAYRKGIRWADLKRLNLDERFAKTLTRNLNGQTYILEPNDLRYTLLIPEEAIKESKLEQNPR